MKEFEDLKRIVAETEEDVTKCDAGNAAAGTRVRKQMQRIRTLAQDIRKAVLAAKK